MEGGGVVGVVGEGEAVVDEQLRPVQRPVVETDLKNQARYIILYYIILYYIILYLDK